MSGVNESTKMQNPSTPRMDDRNHHLRNPAEWLAGCSDVGRRHVLNQDAFSVAVRSDGTAVAAVSDGVSSAADAERASLVAVGAASRTLSELVDDGASADDALQAAFLAAQTAVLDAAELGPPSACTMVACVLTADEIVVGNIGDSRAYWLGDDGHGIQLSTDDSMAEARIQLGLTREQAEASEQAHAITRWLGRDVEDVTPTLRRHHPRGPGWMVLCTDGLWNYASSPEQMGELVHGLAATAPSVAGLAEELVAWARSRGGHDNITVVLARRSA